MGTLSTHVLDTSLGRPAQGVSIRLETMAGAALGEGVTDVDGRISTIGPERLASGDYRLVFDSGTYYAQPLWLLHLSGQLNHPLTSSRPSAYNFA